MKKIIGFILILAIAAALVGCGSTFSTKESGVLVEKNGKILVASIEKFDKEYYKEKDLEKYINGEIDSYQKKSGKGAVKLTSFKIEDDMAKLFIRYQGADDYQEFNGEEFYLGSLPELMAAGYDFGDEYFTVKDGKIGKQATREEFLDNPDLKAVILREKIAVEIPGKIRFVSNNVKVLGKDRVTPIKNDKGEPLNDGTQADYITVIYE